MNRLKIIVLSVVCWSTTLYAQNETDALKYTQTFIAGTARAQGVGGAFGAVGADFSTAAINPAGLGLYRRNEVMFGMATTTTKNSASYFGNTLDDTRGNFNIPSWGGVATKVFSELGEDVKSGLVSISIAGGMNRVSDYQENIRFSGTNTQSSILDYYKNRATGTDSSVYSNGGYFNDPSALAWWQYLIDNDGSPTNYKALTDGVSNYKLLQQQQMQLRGGANEYSISSGANISNIVYVGAGLVIKHAYSETSIMYNEETNGTVPYYTNSSLKQEINSSGVGVGGRFGIIVRPIDVLKLGFAVQTPMHMKMTDEYKYISGSSNYSGVYNIDPGQFDYYDYDVISPAKLTMSGAITLPKIGFVSVDYETVDYTQMRMQSDDDFFTETNNTIKNTLQRANNLRIGAEVKIAEFYRLRGGYAVYSNPYKNDGGEDLNRYAITGGIGFLIDRIFVDFAVVNSYGKQFISPYTTGDATKPDPKALSEYSSYNFVLSGGVRF